MNAGGLSRMRRPDGSAARLKTAAGVGGIRLGGRVTVRDVAHRLPSIADLRSHCRSLAMLDAILSPDREARYYSFNARRADGEEIASMRNGSGDEYSIVFSRAGAYVRGFDHESPMSPYADEDHEPWPGVIDDVPAVFQSCVDDPVFRDEEDVPVVTACLWREATDDQWHHGAIDFPTGRSNPDGATTLFALLIDRTPEAFKHFAEDYYEVPVDLEAVRHVYASKALTQELVTSLNAEVVLTDLAKDIVDIGYPQPGHHTT